VVSRNLGIRPEDFDFIPANQHLYMCDPDRNAVLKLAATFDSFYTGALLITQAGELNDGARLFIVYWDDSIGDFVVRSVSYIRPDGLNGHFEHVSFAPLNLPTL